jgi:excisionase family DNA binding protein
MMVEYEKLVTEKEAADFLGVRVCTVQLLARRGKLPARKVGRYWRFRLSELHKWATDGSNAHETEKAVSAGQPDAAQGRYRRLVGSAVPAKRYT